MRVAIHVGRLVKGLPLSFTFYVNITNKRVLWALISVLTILAVIRFLH